MLRYIAGDEDQPGLKPHLIQNTLSVNDARRIILELSKPLADITDLVQDNLTVLERHQNIILASNLSIAELQKSLYLPAINLKQTSLTNPVTVCTSDKCANVYTFAGLNKYHYKQQCHKDCNLPNVPTELIGTPLLLKCDAIDPATNQCRECKCDFSTHMHITYDTELFEDKVEDETVKRLITNEEEVIRAKGELIVKLKTRSNEYLEEKSKISKAIAKFAYFLNENSISPCSDAFENYIDYLIDREKSRGADQDKDILMRYIDLKKQYAEEKALLQHAILEAKLTDTANYEISSSDILKYVDELYNLKHTGKKIRELHKKQAKVQLNMHEKSMEYCHPEPIQKPSKKKNKPKNKKTLEAESHLHDISQKIKNLKLAKGSTSSEGTDSTLLAGLLSEYFKETKNINSRFASPVNEIKNNLNINQNPKAKSNNKNKFPKEENEGGKKNPASKNEKQNNSQKRNEPKKENNTEKKQGNEGTGKNRQRRQGPRFNQGYQNQPPVDSAQNKFQNQPNQYQNQPYNNPFPNQPPNQHFNPNNFPGPQRFQNQFPPNNQPFHPNQFQNPPNFIPNRFQNPPNQFQNHPNQFQHPNPQNFQGAIPKHTFEGNSNPFANYQKLNQDPYVHQNVAGGSGMLPNPPKDGKKQRNKKENKQGDNQFKKSNPRRNKKEESDDDSSGDEIDVKKIENLIKNVTSMSKKDSKKESKDDASIRMMEEMLNSHKKKLDQKEKEKKKNTLLFVYSSND